MSNEDFRRELNAAFERISGSPSPTLPSRVRSAIVDVPATRGPFWIAGLAAAAMAALIVGVLFVANPLHRPPTSSGGPAATSPAATPSPSTSPSPTVVTSPSPSPFSCVAPAPITSPSAPAVAFVSALRTGTHPGYDRLTIEFQNGQPSSIETHAQSGTTFTESPSGRTVTVAGSSGILVTIRGADLHTQYTGPTDVKTGYVNLVEVRSVQDFEGVVQLAIGINGSGCYRVTTLTSPFRLVIDVSAA